MLANATGYLYWGVFSGYGAAVPVSAYAFASGIGGRRSVVTTIGSLVLHLAVGFAQIFGWLTLQCWFVPIGALGHGGQVVVLVVLQSIMVGAVVGGADAHRTMRRVIDDHDAAVRALSVRDAQLAEAHAANKAARAPGDGRYTGQQVGSFTLGRVLGRGAMGEVYAAEGSGGAPAAVKVLAASLLGDDGALRRFQREARVIAAIDSPHIVRMLEVSPPDATFPYLAMELLEGSDLADLLKDRPVREPAEVAAIVRAVAAGLDAAHDAGVVHRDLKPANIFASTAAAAGARGAVTWKILDFGVSKLTSGDATVTLGNLVGTPGYMAPEQARGEAVDRRADVYSLGVVAYRLLTGRPAIVPGDVPAMIHEVVYRNPPRPSELVAMPEAVEAVLAIALAKDRADRFATAGELAAALAAAASGTASPALAERAANVLRGSAWGRWRGRRPTVTTARDPS